LEARAGARPRRRARTGGVEPSRLDHLFGRACVSRGCGRTRARSDRKGVPLRPERDTPPSLATAHMVLLSAAMHVLMRCLLCRTRFLEYEREPGRHPCAIRRPPRRSRRAARDPTRLAVLATVNVGVARIAPQLRAEPGRPLHFLRERLAQHLHLLVANQGDLAPRPGDGRIDELSREHR